MYVFIYIYIFHDDQHNVLEENKIQLSVISFVFFFNPLFCVHVCLLFLLNQNCFDLFFYFIPFSLSFNPREKKTKLKSGVQTLSNKTKKINILYAAMHADISYRFQ